MLPDYRVRQRDYLLEISRALTQELDLDTLLERILAISADMLAGQAGLIALLNNKAGEEKIAEFLSLWVNNPDATRTEQQQQVIRAYENGMIDLTVRIYQLLTPRQKNHLREKFKFWRENEFSTYFRHFPRNFP